jgi:adenylyltransferase/sulfurtransferase
VGSIRICDRDFVELDNLQRQVLFDEEDVRQNLPKAVAAAQKIARINSGVKVDSQVVDVTWANIENLIADADLVLDGTDNFETRFLINDACVKHGKQWVYGGCVGGNGMVLTVIPEQTACFACVVPDLPAPGSAPTCDTAGVLGPAVGVVASLQAAEALKLLSGARNAVLPGLLTVDTWANVYQAFGVKRLPDCPTCVRKQFRFLEAREGGMATSLCGRNAVQITANAKVDLVELERRLASVGRVTRNPYLVRFEPDGYQVTVFSDGRAIVKGTDDAARARAVYARYVGA